MAISYTTNFHFPLLDDGCSNSGAVLNGVLEDLDLLIAELQNPLCIDDELMLYDDEPLYFDPL